MTAHQDDQGAPGRDGELHPPQGLLQEGLPTEQSAELLWSLVTGDVARQRA
jgi:hypothetical protein